MHRYLYEIYKITNKLEESLQVISKLCESDSKNSVYFFEKGRILSNLKKNNEAINYYEQALNLNPEFYDAMKNKALLLQKGKKLKLCIENLKHKISQESNNHVLFIYIAQALFLDANYKESLEYVDNGLLLHIKNKGKDKDYINASILKGNILTELKNYNQAILHYQKLLNIDPNIFHIYHHIATCYFKDDNFYEAINYYKKTLDINPSFLFAYIGISDSYRKINDYSNSLKYLSLAQQIDNNNSLLLTAKAALFLDQKKFLSALALLKKAIRIDESNEIALMNLAVLFKNKKKYKLSINYANRLIEILNNSKKNKYKLLASALCNIGDCYLLMSNFKEYKNYYLKAFDIDNEYPNILGYIIYSKLFCADWKDLNFFKEMVLKKITFDKQVTTPFISLIIKDDPKLQYEVSKNASKFISKKSDVNYDKNNLCYYNHKKPRIAYLSSDFYDHATMNLMVAMFENQNNKDFDYYVFSYSNYNHKNSDVSIRAKKAFKNFYMINNNTDEEIANLIKKNEIDILVDLKGHTKDNRISILSLRPAPIQITFLGFPGTSGAEYIDYVILDKFLVTEENKKYFSEKILLMPDSYQPTDNKRYYPEGSLVKSNLGLPEDKFIFCSFNNPYKIQPEIFGVWMEILNENINSVLWLMDYDHAETRENIYKEASKRGVNNKRIIFTKKSPTNEYLLKLKHADLFLDSYPVCAHTTASDALWVDLPLLTIAGKTMSSRVAGSILNSLKLNELITYNFDDYKKQALKISRDKNYYKKIKQKLIKQKQISNFFNSKTYTNNLETIYKKLYSEIKKV